MKRYFYGIEEIEFIYHGEWSDPTVIYKEKELNYWDVETYLYDIWNDEDTDLAFEDWIQINKTYVLECLDEIVA